MFITNPQTGIYHVSSSYDISYYDAISYIARKIDLNLNLIYPSMAASASDISVGIAFGGTAALEAALAGNRTILLNLTKDYYPWSIFMAEENIIFNSLETLKIEIEKNSNSDFDTNFGDWKRIISNFDNFRDSKGHERIHSFINTLKK